MPLPLRCLYVRARGGFLVLVLSSALSHLSLRGGPQTGRELPEILSPEPSVQPGEVLGCLCSDTGRGVCFRKRPALLCEEYIGSIMNGWS